jgi:hypothetical protein
VRFVFSADVPRRAAAAVADLRGCKFIFDRELARQKVCWNRRKRDYCEVDPADCGRDTFDGFSRFKLLEAGHLC